MPRTAPDFPRPIEVDEDLRTGGYVNAAAKAKHLVVTVGKKDAVLADAYSLDALVRADENGPLVPLWVGEAPETLPQNLAIGSPFPSNPVYRRYDQPFPNRLGEAKPQTPTLAPDLRNTMQSTHWCFWFTVPHPSFHELRLTDGPRLYPEHSVLSDASMRRYVLQEAWSFFSSPDGSKPLTTLSQPAGLDRCMSMIDR